MTLQRRVAVQEEMLPGPRLADRWAQAADLGLQGIEFWSRTLAELDAVARRGRRNR